MAPRPAYTPVPVPSVIDLKASIGSRELTLTWRNPAAADPGSEAAGCLACMGWNVVRRSGPNGPAPQTPEDGTAVAAGFGTTAFVDGLVNGARYSFSVFVLGGSGDAGPAATLTVAPLAPATTGPVGSVLSKLVSSGPNFTASWGPALPPGGTYETQIGTLPYDSARKDYGFEPVYKSLSKGTARSATVKATAGATYYLRTRIRDGGGNVTEWGAPAIAWVPYDDRSLTASGTWKAATGASNFAGTLRTATKAGAALSKSFHGSYFPVIAQTCSTCGQFKVFLDGVLLKTVDTRSSSTKSRQVVWSITKPILDRRTLKIVVVGTKGRPTVRIDGFVARR
ncbi:MAG: hypothetical protein ACT4QG_05135 [Sporichthyaceae bacterium]